MSDIFLFMFMIGLYGLTIWAIATCTITPEERDEMLQDEEMWP